MQAVGERAVVLGGSMAGLLAARVLSDHYERVTIVERDALPDGSQHRPGVPHRSLADFAIAMRNVHYEKGTSLDYHDVYLQEDRTRVVGRTTPATEHSSVMARAA